jgi:hypothetical protein
MIVPQFFEVLAATSTEGGVSSISATNDEVILALIAIIGTSIAALVYTIRNNTIIKGAAQDASDINKAVNNIGPGEHRLYDMISMVRDDMAKVTEAQEEFSKKGWATLPPDIASASGLTEVIRSLQNSDKAQHEKMDQILKALDEHVQWEMSQKYPK